MVIKRLLRGLSVFGAVAVFPGFLSASAVADNWCRPSQAPNIQIKTSTDNIHYDFSKSEKDLNHFQIDTVNPYGNSVITDVGGLMQGGIQLAQTMRYGTLTNTKTQEICYWYTDVTVTLHIYPTIFVASEFPKGSCKHNAIIQHEHQHVIIDREIVNQFANTIGQGLRADLARQPVYGPVPLSQKGQMENLLHARMQNFLSTYSASIDSERRRRQQALDNIHEYSRVNQMCGK